MAVIFLEPCGDADFGTGLWGTVSGAAVATDFVHGTHVKSIKFRPGNADYIEAPNTLGNITGAGGRVSVYLYFNVLPSAESTIFVFLQSNEVTSVFRLRITNLGVLWITDSNSTHLGTAGATLVAGKWYRISLAFTITDTTHNEFRLFVNGEKVLSITNATLINVSPAALHIGNISTNANLDMRASDFYLDDSGSLKDIASDVWVTAKRPFSNGATNDFSTQIGAGDSSYGTGHAPQVNERANSDSNGWSIIGAGSAVTEEYSIEPAATGDFNVPAAKVIDYMGWVRTKALASETGKIIINNVSSNISIGTGIGWFIAMAGSTVYPAGNTDIGIITSTDLTTVSLYECGIIMAFTPISGMNFSNHGIRPRAFAPGLAR